MPKVLIVEDDQTLSFALRDGFEYEGYSVWVAGDGESGLELASKKNPDVIIADIMLPGASGLQLCDQLRKRSIDIPVLFLSARSTETDKVLGFRIGADDYVTKPFSFAELKARVEALLRRTARAANRLDRIQFGEVELNFAGRDALRSGTRLELSEREFQVLEFLAHHAGEVVTRNQLLDAIWGYDDYPFTRTVDVHISKLRQKIEFDPSHPRHLITVHRIGYKLIT